jgi:hypothetical protein
MPDAASQLGGNRSVGVRVPVPAQLRNESVLRFDATNLGVGGQFDYTNALQNLILSIRGEVGEGVNLSAAATFKTSLYRDMPGFNDLSPEEQKRVIQDRLKNPSSEDARALMEDLKKSNPRFVVDTSRRNINMLRLYLAVVASYDSSGLQAQQSKFLTRQGADGKQNIIALLDEKKATAAALGVGVALGAEFGSARVNGMEGFGAFAEIGVLHSFGQNPLNGENVSRTSLEPKVGVNYNIRVGQNGTVGPFAEHNFGTNEARGGVQGSFSF